MIDSVQVEIGKKYGRFSVVNVAQSNIYKGKCFLCRCECGYEADYPAYTILHKQNRYCRKCKPHSGGIAKPDIVGKRINGWEVLAEQGRNEHGALLFKCRCIRCGSITLKSKSQINKHRTDRCSACPPMYRFRIEGTTATGTLPNGGKFLIDAADIPLVSRYFWKADKDGYVVTHKPCLKLHRLIAGVYDPKVMVDHINRNRKDCRRENLRVISTFGNSCNHSLFETNKTGYTGVYYSRNANRYEVKVGYNRKRIKLGSSKDDLISLAQMYNIGASFFFGEYAGELNDVPDPPEGLVKAIRAKCRKYMKASAKAGAFVA